MVGLSILISLSDDDRFMRLEDLANMTELQELWLYVDHEMVENEILLH